MSASPQLATAAARYQRFKEAEKEHLAVMARRDLFAEWTPDVQMAVMAARACIHAASAARASFRAEIRQAVLVRRANREPLSVVLRHIRAEIERLEQSGTLQPDGGWLETEVLEWSIEEYEESN
jgi:hypothetical protein